ncbi:MAG: tRNA modification GTPase [Deltaproteobacteria bacterium]|nr:tRNA modification GTPase [Deltaproteobacteria bacterium]
MDNEQLTTDHLQIPSDGDTICAIATPVGQAGIGIVRISGPLSVTIAGKIFRPKRPVNQLQSHRLYLGQLHDPSSGALIDEVLLSYMQAPNSYTREDVVEINSHSGYLLLSMILQVVLSQGARLARPGEFTLRAFLNGRIDLTQAEAVTNLINSQSARGLHLASRQIQGSFKHEIEVLRQNVVDSLAQVEVAIDFPEEEAGLLPRQEVAKQIQEEVAKPLEALIEVNLLLNEQRAIVTPVPGTTRDVIGSTITINGIPFRLMDTAGFRDVKDEVEKIGIHLAEQKLAEADFLLVVIDQSRPLNQSDLDIVAKAEGKNTLIVINKIDLPPRLSVETALDGFPVVRISALTGQGLDDLRRVIVECVLEGDMDLTSSNVVPNLRHKQALTDAAGFFNSAARSLKEDAPTEIVAVELKSGLDALGAIIGETTSEEILDSIFSQFCLGK